MLVMVRKKGWTHFEQLDKTAQIHSNLFNGPFQQLMLVSFRAETVT